MLPSIGRFIASAPSHHDRFLVVFTINTSGFEFSAQTGVDGLLRDKTRKSGKPPLSPETVQRVVDLALGRATRGGHALDRPGIGQGGRGEPAFGATHPGSSSD
jgi:hypothetical protein